MFCFKTLRVGLMYTRRYRHSKNVNHTDGNERGFNKRRRTEISRRSETVSSIE